MRTFAPGHDQKLVGWLRDMLATGRMDPIEVKCEALRRGAQGGVMYRVENMIRRVGP